MSQLTILQYPDPRLRTRAAPVERFDAALEQLVAAMFETMYTANGVGLAATQVNVHQQILVADMSEDGKQPLALINPRILARRGEQVYQEGCLSFPGIFADVTRSLAIEVAANDPCGQSLQLEFEGPLAVCIQHEMDHLAGKVFVDHLSPLKRAMLLKRLEKHRKNTGS